MVETKDMDDEILAVILAGKASKLREETSIVLVTGRLSRRVGRVLDSVL